MFYGNGGSCDVFSAYTDADGRLESLPGATREGYNFLGWQTEDGTQVTTETVFTADTVVGARWNDGEKTITVTGSGNTSRCCISFSELLYPEITTAGTYRESNGTKIYCYVTGGSATKGTISVNGETVATTASASSTSSKTYTYTVTKNATINLSYSGRAGGVITITEE